MFRFFSRNSFLAYAALPVMLILYRLRLISSPEISFVAADTDLYTPLWNLVFGGIAEGSTLSVAIAIIFAFVVTLVVNALTVTFKFVEHANNLGGFFFIILSSGFIVSQSLHPVSVFAILFGTAVYRMFRGAMSESYERTCFESAFLMSTAFLFWAKTVWFVPLHAVILFTLRTVSVRSFVAILLGIASPLAIAATYFFCTDSLVPVVETYLKEMLVPTAFYKTNFFARSYIVVYALILITAILNSMRNMQKIKIIESRFCRAVIWIVFCASLFIILPLFSFEMQILIAMGGAMLLTSYVMRLPRYRWQEIFTSVLALAAWIVQWYF
ncbi:MAG: hypothetical protein J6Y82_01640 [Bacteroidales bacterium]|nr:hypothetical protein [Bacteroidales bacterium]